MILPFPPRMQSNDNVDFWTQGISDARSERWSDYFANQNGPFGTLYVAGWLSWQKTSPETRLSRPHNTTIQ